MTGIAIGGKAGAGKNAFATILGRELVERGLWPYEMTFAQLSRPQARETRLTSEAVKNHISFAPVSI